MNVKSDSSFKQPNTRRFFGPPYEPNGEQKIENRQSCHSIINSLFAKEFTRALVVPFKRTLSHLREKLLYARPRKEGNLLNPFVRFVVETTLKDTVENPSSHSGFIEETSKKPRRSLVRMFDEGEGRIGGTVIIVIRSTSFVNSMKFVRSSYLFSLTEKKTKRKKKGKEKASVSSRERRKRITRTFFQSPCQENRF